MFFWHIHVIKQKVLGLWYVIFFYLLLVVFSNIFINIVDFSLLVFFVLPSQSRCFFGLSPSCCSPFSEAKFVILTFQNSMTFSTSAAMICFFPQPCRVVWCLWPQAGEGARPVKWRLKFMGDLGNIQWEHVWHVFLNHGLMRYSLAGIMCIMHALRMVGVFAP